MTAWTIDQLERIGEADELELTTGNRTVTIWVVHDGDDLYVRSWRGRNGRWFRRVQATHEGHVSAGGIDRDVVFVETSGANDAVDAAYRSKYARYGGRYVDQMVAPDGRETTLKLVPRTDS